MMPCPACDGTGLDQNRDRAAPCPACGGDAEVVGVKSDIFERANGTFDWIASVPAWEETAIGTSPTVVGAYADIDRQIMVWARDRETAIAGEITVIRPHFDQKFGS